MEKQKRMLAGIEEIKRKKYKIVYFIICGISLCLIGARCIQWSENWTNTMFKQIYRWIILTLTFICLMEGILIILEHLGGGNRKCNKIERELLENKFVDNKGNPPMVLSKRKEKNGLIIEFFSCGIPREEYEKKRELLEVVLGMKIVAIEMGKRIRYVIVKGIAEDLGKNEKIRWENSMMNNEDFVLRLGINYFDEEVINLSEHPHMLIGGGSGSGKSSLVKLIAFQSIMKGAEVIIGDFKSGVDYNGVWREKAVVIVKEEEFLKELIDLVEIMENREALFVEEKVVNIEEYNEKYPESKMKRIIVICDEFGQILAKRDKKDKKGNELRDNIESQLIKLASRARCSGIHLVMATQRPDSDVLTGQIKGNLTYKICGRADSVLSKIIIDDTNASKIIPQNDVGYFATNFHTLFKAYYVDDSCWEEV